MTDGDHGTSSRGQSLFRNVPTLGVGLLIVVVGAGMVLRIAFLVFRPFSMWMLLLLIIAAAYIAVAVREIRRRKDR